MISDSDKISSTELGIFIFLAVLGIGVISMPSQLAKAVNNDAWLLSIMSGVISIIFLFIICKVGERHSNLGFVETLRFLFGKILGTILAIPVIIYAIYIVALEMRLFAEVTKLYLLHKTPLEFIILPIIILTVVLVRMGIEPITRSFGIFIVIVGAVVIALSIVSIQNSDLSNLKPILSNPISKYISGLSSAILAYAGYEIMLIMYPYVREPKKAFKASAIAMILICGFYVILIIETIAGLGVEETKALIYPVMARIRAISIPGGFIESIEGLLSSLWVIMAYTSMVAFLYFFSVVFSGVMNHKKQKHFASLSIPFVYLIALQGNSVPEVFKISDLMLNYFGIYTMMVLPVLMLILSFIKGNKIKKKN